MTIAFVIAGIIALLIISVSVSGYLQKQEQIAAQKRQMAAQYYQRAQQAQNICELLRGISINPDIMAFLLNISSENLKHVKQIWPKQINIDIEIEKALIRQKGYKPTPAKPLPFPVNEQGLAAMVNRLRKLNNYLKALQQETLLAEQQYERWNKEIFLATSRLEIEGTLRLAARSVESNHAGSARNFLEYVKNKVDAYPLDPNYKQTQYAAINELAQSLDEKQKALQEENGVPRAKLGESDDDFETKKKW